MRPSPETIPLLIDAAKALKGGQKRLFMAKTVQAMGRGGQRWAQEHLGWCRETIRKGTHELRSGMTCLDAFHCRRRKPAEEHLPRLLDDIRSIADGHSQADPKFQTDRLFTRISAALPQNSDLKLNPGFAPKPASASKPSRCAQKLSIQMSSKLLGL